VFASAVAGDGAERRLSRENDALLDTLDVAAVEPFQVKSTDGETVHGWLMKPPGFGKRKRRDKKWPLVLEVHGGPETMYVSSFMHEFQVLGRGDTRCCTPIRAAARATARLSPRKFSQIGVIRTRRTAWPPWMRLANDVGSTPLGWA
jgi:hypothetical protein